MFDTEKYILNFMTKTQGNLQNEELCKHRSKHLQHVEAMGFFLFVSSTIISQNLLASDFPMYSG